MSYTTSINPRILMLSLLAICLLLTSGTSIAQDDGETLDWVYGPAVCPLGDVAQIAVPEGYQFVDGDGARTVMEWLENPSSGREMGLVMPEPVPGGGVPWFLVFEFDPIGYVKDDEKDKLDAEAILESIRRGTENANKIRRERGWEEFHVIGWQRSPFYDVMTNNLKWAIIGEAESGQAVNFSTRLLGRGGAMSADMVASPEDMGTFLPEYESLLESFSFTAGHRYAEWRPGDKVSKYGLTALVAGGAGAVAMKTGLLAKFWKLIVVAFVAVAGFIRRILRGLFGRNDENPTVMASTRLPESDSSKAKDWNG